MTRTAHGASRRPLAGPLAGWGPCLTPLLLALLATSSLPVARADVCSEDSGEGCAVGLCECPDPWYTCNKSEDACATNVPLIAGIVGGVIAAIILLCVLCCCCCGNCCR